MHDGKEDIMRKHSHNRAKRGLAAFMLVIVTALILSGASSVWTAGSVSAAENSLPDGIYAVPVSLLNESRDKASMADNALNHEGKLVINGGAATLYMNLVSIKSSGLEGHLMQFDVLKDVQLENGVPKKYSTRSSKTVSTYSVTDDYNKSGSSDKICAGKKYPKVVSIPVDLTQDFTWVHMYIPVMGSLGFGDQIARLKVDVSQAKAMTQAQLSRWQRLETSDGSSDPGKTDPGKTDPGKNNGGGGKNNTNGKTGTGKLDKNDLPDGKYTVTVHLWHATQNRESMGNATLNHQALITVKKGVYTMDISTHPVKIGSVTACLQSLWIKQSGGYAAAQRIFLQAAVKGSVHPGEDRPEGGSDGQRSNRCETQDKLGHAQKSFIKCNGEGEHIHHQQQRVQRPFIRLRQRAYRIGSPGGGGHAGGRYDVC